MARTTYAEVIQIMEDCTVSSTVIDSYITAANALITKVFEEDTNNVPAALLTEMERWLTAHMIACSLQRSTEREKLGMAELKYTGEYGKMLESTPYGQMVLTLDFTGNMKKMGKGRASIHAVKQFD